MLSPATTVAFNGEIIKAPSALITPEINKHTNNISPRV